MRLRSALSSVLLFAACSAYLCGESETPREIAVAAAADLKFALDEAVAEFERDNPDAAVRVTYGSSGNFFAQISNGAPFDLFLSADIEYPRRLIESGFAVRGNEFLYAVGRIVVWATRSSPVDPSKLEIGALTHPSIRRIAIANPRHAPYGRAAEAAMKKLGVYEAVKDRLVLGENVAQTAQFVESGAADVGIFALSLAMALPLRDEGRFWMVPLDAYPRLEQGGVVLSRARERRGAEQLRAFLSGEKGRKILKRYGFSLPGE